MLLLSYSFHNYSDDIVSFSYSLSGEYRIKNENNDTSFADMSLTSASICGDLKLTRGLEKVGKIAGWVNLKGV